MIRWQMGLDVGSTTIKGVVSDTGSGKVVWKRYRRHDGRQGRQVLAFLEEILQQLDLRHPEELQITITGSGGSALSEPLGAHFVQEVNAVSLAVEKLHPETGSVIELGGQDAKIILFRDDPATGQKKKICTMNDKCAGGTGAVLDKIAAKLGLSGERMGRMPYGGIKLHPVAGKCGVFAETDINSLQKLGVPAEELMASLFEAIVQQNLTVLTRGNTLLPTVLLLGGPNTFIRGLAEAWRHNLARLWEERNVPLPAGTPVEQLVRVPEDAHFFAAIGAVEYARQQPEAARGFHGLEPLREYLSRSSAGSLKRRSSGRGLVNSEEQLQRFLERYRPEPFRPASFAPGERVAAFLGIDSGSTSTKAVLLSPEREVLAAAYGLSGGNPVEDTQQRVAELRGYVEDQGAQLEILGAGTTGYAKDLLRELLGCDTAVVETVAHTRSALHFHGDVDVICDVGGQDIKLIFLRDGTVKEFKLNTQCSAGNGYFLQSSCKGFGIEIDRYAEEAFRARAYPEFSYGCAVFLQAEIVDFQRQGWEPHEILAGLAAVLPKNIWHYVAKLPNLPRLGRHFVLQGGTQRNLAAVRAQVEFIEERFRESDLEPRISVHRFTGESGAIGAALEAIRVHHPERATTFIGLDALAGLTYRTRRDESTRCGFCKSNCLRTFVDIELTRRPAGNNPLSVVPASPVSRRFINAPCDRGQAEELDTVRRINSQRNRLKRANPDLSRYAAQQAWRDFKPDQVTGGGIMRFTHRRERGRLRIGMPRVLNLYSLAPFFSSYLTSLGVPFRNLVFSDYTSEELYREGSRRGAIDPCFPSKVALAHLHNLMQKHHQRGALDWILFPKIASLPTPLSHTLDSAACPTATATPESVRAALCKEGDLFRELGIRYVSPFLSFAEPELLARQMWHTFGPLLGLGRAENRRACAAGWEALEEFGRRLRAKGREILERLEAEQRLGIVLLGRPYHNDPGINHRILEELQRLGYPVLTIDSLPLEDAALEPLFAAEIRAGEIRNGRDIGDVWKNSYSENSNRKIWAAKYVARHPLLVGMEFSSFKCGHDAPIYNLIEQIVEQGGTPFFAFRDLDENRSAGSIKIRIETIDYFLRRYRERLPGATVAEEPRRTAG
ncbi:MAG TPA: CoA activase [Gammaproteobacteria bacterium]|nr:CoA activase [Gammaproteobacteria bacterium]